jgi:hypothetical protein
MASACNWPLALIHEPAQGERSFLADVIGANSIHQEFIGLARQNGSRGQAMPAG